MSEAQAAPAKPAIAKPPPISFPQPKPAPNPAPVITESLKRLILSPTDFWAYVCMAPVVAPHTAVSLQAAQRTAGIAGKAAVLYRNELGAACLAVWNWIEVHYSTPSTACAGDSVV